MDKSPVLHLSSCYGPATEDALFSDSLFPPPLLVSFQEVPNLKTLNQRASWQGHVEPESRVLQSGLGREG